ncbi:endopeptidase La [Oscillibacter valericigenes]|uniref:endopeptidase La n=1 Tax=Oscillibacter valericigenes TaxID=351091 RepID=UPI001F27DE8D|nr:endopeptidase La [Oscillibacter valericigenes]MCF2664250.1 endopeptidase La [Oscillibacter valericigenes]
MEAMNLNIPVLALRGLTVFPHMTMTFDVERRISIRALERAMEEDQEIFLVTQREIGTETPGEKDLYAVGTISHITQILRLSKNSIRVMVEGRRRARLRRLWQTEPFLQANVEELEEPAQSEAFQRSPRTEALLRQTWNLFSEYAELAGSIPEEVVTTVMDGRDVGYLADFIAQNIALRFDDKQEILEELAPFIRLRKLNGFLARECNVLGFEHEMEGKVRDQLARTQRDQILRTQIRVLQNELGEGEDGDDELDTYRQKIQALELDEDTTKHLLKEVTKLSKQPFGSAEGAVIRGYLDVCLEMPWNTYTKERVSVDAARKVLEKDHYGLEKVKERILETIAVRQMNPEGKGQIICLVGPPGVGKTSIAISVAKALNRKLARLSLGGVRDEADIRGHRKTYIGSMPGRIIEAISRSGSMNPLLLLDEIDKMGNDYRGDPAAALLEVLDSEQNHSFRDHFLEIPVDLSKVMFITTANTIETIPRPLLDRMELIQLSSYTDEEKVQIARRHLLPKQMEEHGLKKGSVRVSDDVLRAVIRDYTRESGVRLLERRLAAICRKADMRMLSDGVKRITVTENDLPKLLDCQPYPPALHTEKEEIGVVNGLAWTEAGGEILEVEVNVMEGTGKLELTGNLGDVMKESAQAALSCLRSRAAVLGIPADFYKTRDIHVHFPEGAVPKDGPSAGIAMATAMLSALTDRKIKAGVAMTGEITLRGRVLPIGGLREKTMAARRNGIGTVLIPKDNVRDLEDIDQTVRAALRFIPVATVDEVFAAALCPESVQEEGTGCVAAFAPLPREKSGDAALRQ